jgi:isoleucyl-tRNA synthetase
MSGLTRLAEQIRDELNVKDVRIVHDDADLVEYSVSAIPSQVGKKYKALFPAIKAALSNLDAAQSAVELRAGRPLQLLIQGEAVTLAPEDVQVKTSPRSGYVLCEDAGYMVAVNTEISETLRQEGLVRELVRRIQTMRKDAGFRIEDTIATYYNARPELSAVIVSWKDYVQQETLTGDLVAGPAPEGAFTQQQDLDGEQVTLGVIRR